MRYVYLIFNSFLLLAFQGIDGYAQISADIVYFNEDHTEAILELSFEKPLSKDSVYSSGLPFNFAILAPYDSISIASVEPNDAFDTFKINFNTKPNTYYSLLTMDIQSEEGTWHSFGTHFFTGTSESKLDSIVVNNKIGWIIVKESIQENTFTRNSIVYNTTVINFLVTRNDLKNLQERFSGKEEFDFHDSLLRKSIKTASFFLFEQLINDTLFDYDNGIDEDNVFTNLKTSYQDSVVMVSLLSGRHPSFIDKLNIPIWPTIQTNSINSNTFDFFTETASQFSKPFLEWDSIKVDYPLLFVGVSNENELVNLKPSVFSISPAYPNPFNPTSQITINLNEAASLQMNVYSVTGERVHSWNGEKTFAAGAHAVQLNFSSLASGVYLVEFVGISLANGNAIRQTTKVSLLK